MTREQIFEYLEQLDEWLSSKQRNEKIVIFLFPAIILGFISYQWLLPLAEQFKKHEDEKRHFIERTIDENQQLLSVPNEIKLLTEKRNNLVMATGKLYNDTDAIDERLKRELPFLYADDTRWASFLATLSQKASQTGLKILKLESETIEANKTTKESNKTKKSETLPLPSSSSQTHFEKAMRVNVALSGSYNGFLRFVHSIEKDDNVVSVERLSLRAIPSTQAEVTFILWGLKP